MDTPKTVQEPSTKEDKKSMQSGDGTASEKSSDNDKGVKKRTASAKPRRKNNVRKMRMDRMMSKAELARRAGLSTLTIDRVEKGMSCRMDTKRKILEALGFTPSDRTAVFGDDD